MLKLMYAAIIRASERRRGLTITLFEREQLEVTARELDQAHLERHAPAVQPST